MADCTVIIPFYQTKLGILTRALKSVFAQSYQDFNVIVVDDQSPLPAEQELLLLPPAQRERIRIIRQQNKGPGGARNAGLEAATHSGAIFIAFLDSDDVWQPFHLADAYDALITHGADIYWACMEADEKQNFIPYRRFSEIDSKDLLRQFGPEGFFYEITDLKQALLTKWWNFFHMSTFAASRSVFCKARFDEKFRIAAEDILFFFSCATIGHRVIVSDKIAGKRGVGDNLYHGAKFGTKKTLSQLYYSRLAIERIAELGNFTDKHALQSLDNWREETRDSGAACGFQALVHGRLDAMPLFLRWFTWDPRMAVAIWGRAKNKYLAIFR